MRETLGDRIKKLRMAAELSQGDLAEKVGDKSRRPATVSAWEAGATPKWETLAELVEFFGVSGHWLLTGEGPRHVDPSLDARAFRVIARYVDRVRARDGELLAEREKRRATSAEQAEAVQVAAEEQKRQQRAEEEEQSRRRRTNG